MERRKHVQLMRSMRLVRESDSREYLPPGYYKLSIPIGKYAFICFGLNPREKINVLK